MALPSMAQAKMLARAWIGERVPGYSETAYTDPTVRSCVRRGWFDLAGVSSYPGRETYQRCVLSVAGRKALADFLAKEAS